MMFFLRAQTYGHDPVNFTEAQGGEYGLSVKVLAWCTGTGPCAFEGFLPTKGRLLGLPQDSLSPHPTGQRHTDTNRTQTVAETKGLGTGSLLNSPGT